MEILHLGGRTALQPAAMKTPNHFIRALQLDGNLVLPRGANRNLNRPCIFKGGTPASASNDAPSCHKETTP
jgi:hypothetical protein